jgi:predicted phage terminase large subunit-like protein
MSASQERLLAEKFSCQSSLAIYCRKAWPVLEPDTPFLPNWHIDAMADYLTACVNGQITRLIINIPPRYMKSYACTIFWPTWIWGPLGRPGERFIFASYAQDLATEHSVKRRVLLESPWYQKHWGNLVSFTRDQNQKQHFTNTRRGAMYSTGMSGTTGFGGNFIVVDDPHDTRNIVSQKEREAQVAFFRETLMRRLDDKLRGVIVIVMQRLGVDDLTGWVLENLSTPKWEHLKLPGEAHEYERIVFPVSKRIHERQPGELLWPEREGPEQIHEAKVSLGSRGYAGQYDQEPVPFGGAVFHNNWWRYYDDSKVPSRYSQIIMSIDGAYKTGQENDHSCITVWGYEGERRKVYLLFVWRGKEEFPDFKRRTAALIIRWHPNVILIEDKASGTPLVQEFRETIQIDDRIKTLLAEYGYNQPIEKQYVCPPIHPVQVDKDKLARAEAVTPMLERGDVLLPDPSIYDVPWLSPYLKEFALFTGRNDPEDDQVDSTTQLLNYVRGLGSFIVADFYRRHAEMAEVNRYARCNRCRQPILDNQPYLKEMNEKCHVACATMPLSAFN